MWKLFNHPGSISLEQLADDGDCDQDIEIAQEDRTLRVRCNDRTTAGYTSFSVPIEAVLDLVRELGYEVIKK